MRSLVLLLLLFLAGCAGVEQRQVYMEHPTKTHAQFNTDWAECDKHLPVVYMFNDWPVHSFQVARCMEQRKGWQIVDVEPTRLF